MISIQLEKLIKTIIELPLWAYLAFTASIIVYFLFQGINSSVDMAILAFSVIFTFFKIINSYQQREKTIKLEKTFHITFNPEYCIWAAGRQGENSIVTLRAECKIKNCTSETLHLFVLGIDCKEKIIHRDIVPNHIPAHETIGALIVLALDMQLKTGESFITKLSLTDSIGNEQSFPIEFKSI